MSNVLRHRKGTPRLAKFKVEAAVVISVGDLVYGYTSTVRYVKPAASFTWDTSIAITQNSYAKVHVGVAMQQHLASDTIDEIMVDTSPDSIFVFPCASATFVQDTLLGPAKAAGNALESQKLVAVASENLAIGKVSNNVAVAATEVEMTAMYSTIAVPPAVQDQHVAVTAKTAIGSTQAHAIASAPANLEYGLNVVAGGDATTGVVLPVAVIGKVVHIKNNANAVLNVYPYTGAAINAINADTTYAMAALKAMTLIATSATQWFTIPLLGS
jgi:hypothetical protein